MRKFLSWRGGLFLLALLLAGSFGTLRSQEPEEIVTSVCRPICPGAGKVRAFEGLRGNLLPHDGYTYSISPNEEWIAAFDLGGGVKVAHVPTGKTWFSKAPADDSYRRPGIGSTWRPNCFSQTGDELFYTRYVVALTPGMSGLAFRPVDNPVPGYRLGGSSYPENPEDFGKIAWSADRRFKYEAVGSQLRITPPGKLQAVDFSEPERGEREDQKQAMESMDGLISQLGKEEARKIRKAFQDLGQQMIQGRSLGLEQLAVSPDGRYLAAVAEKSDHGNFGTSSGVIISLRHQPPVARRFAVNVFHKIFWSAHGPRIYFYAQPTPHLGEGTIYQLDFKDF
jgi:hypothetical protein